MPRYYIPKNEFRIIDKNDIEPYLIESKSDDMRYLLMTTWLTGSRISEVIELIRWKVKIDCEKKDITFVIDSKKHGKQGFPSFNFDDPFIMELIPFFESKGKDDRLFFFGKRYYQKQLQELNKSIHGDDTNRYITFHQLRHSRLSHLSRVLRAFPEELKSWTGHQSNAFEQYFSPRRVDRFRGHISD